MTEEQDKIIRRVHDWLFVPPMEGRDNRAKQLDDVMAAIRAGKLGGRATLWAAGAIAAILTAYAQLKGLGK